MLLGNKSHILWLNHVPLFFKIGTVRSWQKLGNKQKPLISRGFLKEINAIILSHQCSGAEGEKRHSKN
jgi:hypothetical protein